ncbi:MAG: hypothetical protein ACHQ3O_07765, partial [Candidatus Limnocylindria bacterium]
MLAMLLGACNLSTLTAKLGLEGEPPEKLSLRSGKFVQPVLLPKPGAPLSPGRVVFLPFINRTERCIHPTYLRALDVTLAAHAGIFLNLEVVRPELAERLAAELDFPHDFYKQAELIPSREQL